MIRVRAIVNAIVHGVLPYWCYEKVKHYNCSYWQHLKINMSYAFRWITFNETQSDIEFEQ